MREPCHRMPVMEGSLVHQLLPASDIARIKRVVAEDEIGVHARVMKCSGMIMGKLTPESFVMMKLVVVVVVVIVPFVVWSVVALVGVATGVSPSVWDGRGPVGWTAEVRGL